MNIPLLKSNFLKKPWTSIVSFIFQRLVTNTISLVYTKVVMEMIIFNGRKLRNTTFVVTIEKKKKKTNKEIIMKCFREKSFRSQIRFVFP